MSRDSFTMEDLRKATEDGMRQAGMRFSDDLYDPSFAGGKDTIPRALLPFGGQKPVSYIDDVEYYAWTAL